MRRLMLFTVLVDRKTYALNAVYLGHVKQSLTTHAAPEFKLVLTINP